MGENRTMSTFYATFENSREGRETVDELLRDGVPPENISLVALVRGGTKGEGLVLEPDSLGDASFFVGRSDDPEQSPEFPTSKAMPWAAPTPRTSTST
jgi:hypothetical protein